MHGLISLNDCVITNTHRSQFLGIALVSFSHGISGQLQRCWWPSPLGRHGRRRRCAVALESTCLAVFFYTLRAIHDSPFILVGLLVSNCDGVRVNRAIYWVWRMLFVCRKKESMSSPLTKQAQNRENFYEEKIHFHRFLSGSRNFVPNNSQLTGEPTLQHYR